MLPVYNSEQVHHRPISTAGALLALGSGAQSHVFGAFGNKQQQRKRVQGVLQGVIVLLVLLPLWLLLSHRVGPSALHAGSGGGVVGSKQDVNRKLMRGRGLVFPAASLKNLVLVAGHAVYVGLNYADAFKESSWFLEEYQKVPGEAQSFVEHIELGVKEAAADPDALLLFSGGQTRRAAGPRSEGMSYWVVAEAAGWFNLTDEVRGRAFTEEHARDSFENLLFSLCRFYELTGRYPETVTVVSYTLKQARFETLHCTALHFPSDRFRFIGTPVPPAAKGAQAGEAKTAAAFRDNPYGCTGELLQKRLGRDPFAVGPPHPSRCPDLRGLLQHCATTLYEGPVPWDATGGSGGGGSEAAGDDTVAAA